MWPMPSVLTFPPEEIIDDMETEEKEKVFTLWIDWNQRVVSFEKEEGFEELRYSSHEEMFRFAIERGNEGFGIQ